MLESFVTLVFLVAGLQDGLALLDPSAARLAHPGDAAVIYQLDETPDAAERWSEVGRGRVVESGQGPAVVWSASGTADPSSLRVALRVPEDRVSTPEQSFEQAGAALVAVEDSDLLTAVDQIIPDNERVELAVLAILDQRWRIRDAQSEAGARETSAEASSEAPSGTSDTASPLTTVPGSAGRGQNVGATASTGEDPLANIPKAQVGENDLIPMRVEVTAVDPELIAENAAARDGAADGTSRSSQAVAELPGSEPPASSGITSRVQAWARARAAGDLDTVLAFYAQDFEPADGLQRGEWADNLRAALAASGPITVDLVDLKAGLYGSTERARVLFTEHMTVDGIARDPQRVRLVLTWEEDEWFILEESTVEGGGL